MEYKLLNDGTKIPMLGYGVFMIDKNQCEKCVLDALEVGYRHIDAAQIYGNETEVGNALISSGISRNELYLTTKIWVTEFGYESTKKSIDSSLKRLKTDYVDLMLLHRPYRDYLGAWKALEEGVKEGKIKSIGISNFTQKQTRQILDIAQINPVINQIECHPYFTQDSLIAYLNENKIATEAWYPLGHGNKKLLTEPTVQALAQKYGKTPAQIILRWHIQKGQIIFPKTVNKSRMVENFQIFDFTLEEQEVQAVSALNKNKALFTQPDWLQKLNLLFSKPKFD
ncbi:MAG: aldo/keto reductase [Clostridiales bacterium]|nr:aldo/keto reductase [Clostridiales bacterium]